MEIETSAIVSGESLRDLQGELISLSKQMEAVYGSLSQALSVLNESWRDGMYDAFVAEFRSSKEMIIEISERYRGWAKKELQLKIEQVADIASTSMSVDGSSTAGGSIVSSIGKVDKAEAFREGKERVEKLIPPKKASDTSSDSGREENQRERKRIDCADFIQKMKDSGRGR